MKPVDVSPLSEEFGRIEYELQLQLNAPRLAVKECKELSNPHIYANFMNFCKSMTPQNIVDVFIPLKNLKQSVDEILSKGIKIDTKKGFRFTVGHFDVNREDKEIEVIRLSVALGHTLNHQSSDDLNEVEFLSNSPKSDDLENGYHSFCLSDEGEYCVFNSAQILTKNYVTFEGGSNLDPAEESDNICDQCRKEKATIWCINDGAKLCPDCDEKLHTQEITKKHKRISLAEARSMIEFCPIHPDQRVEYYCTQCNCPVCYKCKMTGSHSKGNAATHPLVEIKFAYNESLKESKQEAIYLTRRKKLIEEKMEEADNRLQSIVDNENSIEEEIRRIADAAIEQAKKLAGKKALIIRSNKTELERKLNEIKELSDFIQKQRDYLSPLAFLRTFDRHGLLIQPLQETNDLPPALKVEPDLCVFGSVDVGTKANSPEQATANQSQIQTKSIKKQGSPKGSPSSNQRFQSTIRDNYYDNDDYDVAEEDNNEPASISNADNYQQREVSISESNPQQYSKPPKNDQQQQKKSSSKQSLKRKSDAGPEYTSLIALAQRREQKNKNRGLELTFQPFGGTQIINGEALCTALYLCFPFKAQPQTHLLFSTERDGRSIKKMHEMIDGIGITAVLVKKGEFVFGGFAAAKWNHDGEPFGEGSSSFLFSLSQDAFIPYKPRIKDACHLYATEDNLTFGKFDLILEDNFDKCSAIIENSYGIGFPQGSTEAQTFLAGQPVFKADIVEVWGFFTIEQQ